MEPLNKAPWHNKPNLRTLNHLIFPPYASILTL
jgi:hypothetical protein